VVLAAGPPGGSAAADAGVWTSGAVAITAPADGAFHAATLVVTGTFAGQGEAGPTGPETVRVSSRLTWGTMPAPVPTVASPDPGSGGWSLVAVLPSVQEAEK